MFDCICIGGYDRGECLNTFESYDISSNKWSKLPGMLGKRGRFDVASAGDDVLYAVAGSNGQVEENSVEKFDFATNKWKYVASLPVRLSNIGEHSSALHLPFWISVCAFDANGMTSALHICRARARARAF